MVLKIFETGKYQQLTLFPIPKSKFLIPPQAPKILGNYTLMFLYLTLEDICIFFNLEPSQQISWLGHIV